MTKVNDPAIVAEVMEAFEGYYSSLSSNDVPAVQAWFFQSPETVRFGNAENLFGSEEINAYRSSSPPSGRAGIRERVVVATFGRDFGTTSSLTRPRPGRVGRTTQAWVRFPEGWKIVAAHVSTIDDPG